MKCWTNAEQRKRHAGHVLIVGARSGGGWLRAAEGTLSLVTRDGDNCGFVRVAGGKRPQYRRMPTVKRYVKGRTSIMVHGKVVYPNLSCPKFPSMTCKSVPPLTLSSLNTVLHTCQLGYTLCPQSGVLPHWAVTVPAAAVVRVHSLNNVPYLAWNLECRCVSGAYLR